MATRKAKLTAKGLRTLKELRSSIPVGGSCWIIISDPHTKRPKGVEEFTRISTSNFESVLADDEENLQTSMTIEHILKQPYGGAWLKKGDATKYFNLLVKFWEHAPFAIDALAQEEEKKALH